MCIFGGRASTVTHPLWHGGRRALSKRSLWRCAPRSDFLSIDSLIATPFSFPSVCISIFFSLFVIFFLCFLPSRSTFIVSDIDISIPIYLLSVYCFVLFCFYSALGLSYFILLYPKSKNPILLRRMSFVALNSLSLSLSPSSYSTRTALILALLLLPPLILQKKNPYSRRI